MRISSRTPEGEPYQCPVCVERTALETSDTGDTLCPACGQLLWRIRHALTDKWNLPLSDLDLDSPLSLIDVESLELVELVMSLEEQLELTEADVRDIRTIEDVLRWLRQRESGAE